ncbi:MAG: hypothetical protein KDA84_12260 [Planctomycetaceae bacterium]|nr:hypothetical protein [Planctomycetaceae bacterium]
MNNLFAQMDTPSMNIATWSYGIALLVLVALVLVASTVVGHRQLSWKASFTQGLGSLLWASPVIAILACVAMRVLPQFQFGTARQQPANAMPSWLEENEGDLQVEDVYSFREPGSNVSIDLEESPEEGLPEWTEHKVQRKSNGDPTQTAWRLVLENKNWEVSLEDARANLAKQAAQILEKDFSDSHSEGTRLSPEEVESLVLRGEAVTSQVFNKDSSPFTGYKVYWQIEVSPEIQSELAQSWESTVATKRAWVMGELIALFTLIAASFAGYFHLDKRTNGNNRFRLKLAATALMTAGALGVLVSMSAV